MESPARVRVQRGDAESMKPEKDDAYLMVYDPATGEIPINKDAGIIEEPVE